MTDNQLYRGINTRFDKRAKLLRSLGFTYRIAKYCEHDRQTFAYFERRSARIMASVVLLASNQIWRNTLSVTLIR